jgi:hypothetical protein
MRYLLILLLLPLNMLAQTFTYSGYVYNASGTGAANVPVKLYKRTTTTTSTGNTTVRTFKTHASNGSTNQYQSYPSTRSEMDRLFNTAWSNTVLWWSGTVAASYSLNFNSASTLTSGGASVPNGGDFYSTEVTFSLVAKETGTYSFGLTSDDGGDLWLVNSGNVIEWYGGKGTGQYLYGNVSLVKGTTYTFIARMQEYGGGDGLIVYWKRPSQSTYSLQTDEIGVSTTTTTAWTLDATAYTNVNGLYSLSRASGTNVEWYIQFDAVTPTAQLQTTDINGACNVVLGKTAFNGAYYYIYDVNGDGKITVSDAYYIGARKQGRFSNWVNTFTSKLFTTTEYNAIKATSFNLKSTYAGVSSITINSPTSGGSSNFYLVAPGYSDKATN